MVTDRDLVIRVFAEGRNLKAVRVSKAMCSGVVYCFEDDDIKKASHLMVMAQRQIRRLPTLSRANKLVGIVTSGDLTVHGENPQRSRDALEQVSTPAHPKRGLSER